MYQYDNRGNCTEYHHYDHTDITTGVQNRVGQEVSLYPNPASGRIVLDGLADGEAEVSVHDLSGRLVLTRRASGPTTALDVTALALGCYVVSVVQENEEKVVKMVVE